VKLLETEKDKITLHKDLKSARNLEFCDKKPAQRKLKLLRMYRQLSYNISKANYP